MIKVMRRSNVLEMGAIVGIDTESDGLKRAQRLGDAVTHEGIERLQRLTVWPEIGIVFDETSAGDQKRHSAVVTTTGRAKVRTRVSRCVEMSVGAVSLET